MTAQDVSVESVLKENAMFLLELNQSMQDDSKEANTSTSPGWTINLFPQTTTPPNLRSSSYDSQEVNKFFKNSVARSFPIWFICCVFLKKFELS